MAAFDEALRQGCDGIELDLQLSRDGVPVVYHDRTLLRAGGGRFRVVARSLEELRALRPGARFGRGFRDERIPTLRQVLTRYARKTRLLLEIKSRRTTDRGEELARAVVREVRRCTAAREIYLLSFDPDVVGVCAAEAPKIPRVLNLQLAMGAPRGWRKRLGSVEAVAANIRFIRPSFVASLRDTGRPLMVYSCNSPGQVEQALRAGASVVMTDRPGWLTGYMRRSRVEA